MLYFGNRLKTSEWLSETDLGELAAAEAVIGIRVPKPEEPAPLAKSRVPANRLTAADLWTAYGVAEPDLFIVCDKFGNEYRRTNKKELAELVKGVAKHFREQRATVKDHAAAASKARDAGKTAEAISALHKAFKLDLVGYDEAEAARKLYADLMADGRKALLAAGKDSTRLAELAKVYEGSDLAAEIADTQKQVGASG